MPTTPKQTANDLEAKHGLSEAMSIALNGTVEASRVEDNYTLSVWREVKAALRDRIKATKDE